MRRGGPFRPGVVATGEEFTDRATEVRALAEAMTTPGARLLVLGPRRMGKTSAIAAAARRAERRGVAVLSFDLSAATTIADVANRLLDAAARSLGRGWKDSVQAFLAGLGVRLTVTADPSGLLLPALEVSLRSAPVGEQNEMLGRVLDGIDELAATKGRRVAIVMDEFQEISRIGGESAEWHLRARMQAHEHVAYVLSGSEAHVIERMTSENRAFYRMLTPLVVGPIDADHLATWVDARLESEGLQVERAGTAIVELAGPRTQDVVRLARRTYELAQPVGAADRAVVEAGYGSIIDEEAPLLLRAWDGLSPLQQNVLRAVAGAAEGLTTGATIAAYGLGASGSATNAAKTLVENSVLLRAEGGAGYAFDDPFMRGWVIREALPDAGIRLPVTHVAARPAS